MGQLLTDEQRAKLQDAMRSDRQERLRKVFEATVRAHLLHSPDEYRVEGQSGSWTLVNHAGDRLDWAKTRPQLRERREFHERNHQDTVAWLTGKQPRDSRFRELEPWERDVVEQVLDERDGVFRPGVLVQMKLDSGVGSNRDRYFATVVEQDRDGQKLVWLRNAHWFDIHGTRHDIAVGTHRMHPDLLAVVECVAV